METESRYRFESMKFEGSRVVITMVPCEDCRSLEVSGLSFTPSEVDHKPES